MPTIKDTSKLKDFWSNRYAEKLTKWDIGYPSTPIKEYIDQLENKDLRILIPGAGNAYEGEYLFQQGFKNTFILDIAPQPLESLAKRMPTFPKDQLIQANFFEHEGSYDLILEQTFFCSFPPSVENRSAYAKKMFDLLAEDGLLVGLWFKFPLKEGQPSPPFGGSKEEYLGYFEPYFDVLSFKPAENSIKPRLGNELFGIFHKKMLLH